MEFRELSLPIKIAILSSPFLLGGLLFYLDVNYQNLSKYIQIYTIKHWFIFRMARF